MRIDQGLTEKKINDWWEDLEYLEKIRVLLLAWPGLDITGIEHQGVSVLWKKVDPERKKDFYQDAWKRS